MANSDHQSLLRPPKSSVSSTQLQELARQSLLDHFAKLCEGLVIVDAESRIVWMNDSYPARLGIANPGAMIGRPIEAAIPNSLMRQVVETGKPIMIDIMDVGSESFVVARLPLHDDEGRIVGAVGMVLYDDPRRLAPVVARYQQLRAELADTQRRLAETRRTRYTIASFVGVNAACLELKRSALRAARASSAVLILGETGTGKELLAQAVHAASPRAESAFIAVNIAAVPETLLEAEFFGVAPGAYTGADRRGREGKFKLADRGTLFLDEIGDMSLALQAKLLRTLQEREVEAVGSNRLEPVDVRVIAATSRDLEAMVAQGSFRADLYYRLNVICLVTPPLRARLDDLPILCEHLIDSICREQGLPPRVLAPSAIDRLRQHDWPGNVRELANVLERSLLMVDRDELVAGDFDRVMPAPKRGTSAAAVALDPASASLSDSVAKAERLAIQAALRDCKGNKAQAAKRLGISRAALYEKLASLGLDARTPNIN